MNERPDAVNAAQHCTFGRLLGVSLFAGLIVLGLCLAGSIGPAVGKDPQSGKLAADKAAADKAPAAESKADADKKADAKGAGKGDAEHAALVELRDLAERAYDEALGFYESENAFAEEVHRWSTILLHHDLALAGDDEQKLSATQAHLDRMHSLANAGMWRVRELEYYVAEAELMVNRLKPNPDFAAAIAARHALEGEWEVTSIEEDGGASAKPDIRSITVVGRRAVFEHRLGTARALLVLDVATKPASIDILGMNEEFPFGGQGIYKLDGDTLTLCWGAGAVRPSDFSTKAGDGVILCVAKRKK